MNKDQKAQVIDEIAAQISEAEAIYAADYRGLSVSQAAALRGRLREADATFRIVKNTLTLRAAEQAKAEQVKELIEGPTAFAFVHGDPALAAKALDAFARQEQVPTVRGGLVGGELVSGEVFKQLARLPGREQLNAQLAGVVASPLTGLVRGLGSLLSGLAVALGQVQERKASEQPPAEEPAAEQPEAEKPEADKPPEPEAAAADEVEEAAGTAEEAAASGNAQAAEQTSPETQETPSDQGEAGSEPEKDEKEAS